jgi:PAS domain S-box-containing protein
MVSDFLKYLKENKSTLTDTWIQTYCKSDIDYLKKDVDAVFQKAAQAIDAFCDIIENDNFDHMASFLKKIVEPVGIQDISFRKTQTAISSVRNLLLPVLIQKYTGDTLLSILFEVNHSLDRIVFFLCDFFQKKQAHVLRVYAKELEKKIQKRNCELEESRNNYHMLFEEITDGCYVNQDGRIVFANKAFCEMHLYDKEDLIGNECQELIADNSRKFVMKRFYQHLKGENIFETFIYCRQDSLGRSFPTENRIKLFQYKGKPAVLGLCRDITERIEMEEKIKQKDRLVLIGRLTTSIAHEIRNPLSAIKINVQILLEKLKLKGNDLRRLQIAQEQSIHLENILSEIMRFAKPIQLNYSLADIPQLVNQATEFFEEKIKSENISLIREFDSIVSCIMIDRERILEAVTNVLKNALEAFDGNGNGNRQIVIRSTEKTIESKKHIELSFIDNGKGIKQEDKKNIFEPFVTKEKKGGVGLGLSIVKRIVDAHNGGITVNSNPGVGTSFNFLIPVEITH